MTQAQLGQPTTGTDTENDAGPFELTPAQVTYFETFGFLKLPALFASEIDVISDGFEEVFEAEDAQVLDPGNEFHHVTNPRYLDEPRLIIPTFIDKSEKLSWLRNDSRMTAIAAALLGEDFEYAESDGNIFNCDVYWHLDAYGAAAKRKHIKLHLNLDPRHGEQGALRLIPGTHLVQTYTKRLRQHLTLDPPSGPEHYGVPLDEIPSWIVDVDPGDVIVADFRTLHGSFHGPERRRLFTVNYRAAEENG